MRDLSWGTFTPAFVEELADWIGDRRVLEVFAGNGLLASRLAHRGVDIVATTLFAGHDGHDLGMHHDVLEMDATEAVRTLGAETDVLLMSWPTATRGAVRAALHWGAERPIVFVGEVTDPAVGLGGCADDLFFELTEEVSRFGAYEPRNDLERACVRRLDPTMVARWNREGRPNTLGILLPDTESRFKLL